jgi:hypothetical protein
LCSFLTCPAWKRWKRSSIPLKPDLFEQELSNYAEDARDWPDDVTARTFDEWFDLEVHSMVYDAAATPLEVDEEDEL